MDKLVGGSPGSLTNKRVFSEDLLTGITEYYYHDQETGGFAIETVQDMEPHLELAKAMFNAAPLRYGEFTHVKHIPLVLMQQLIKDGILGPGGAILDEPRFKKFLNERDTNFFKTRPGHV